MEMFAIILLRGVCVFPVLSFVQRKKIRVGSRSPFTSCTNISRLLTSSLARLWFEERIEEGEWW